jgi:hypothetical protein
MGLFDKIIRLLVGSPPRDPWEEPDAARSPGTTADVGAPHPAPPDAPVGDAPDATTTGKGAKSFLARLGKALARPGRPSSKGRSRRGPGGALRSVPRGVGLDAIRLARHGLPRLEDGAALAGAMSVPVERLTFLADPHSLLLESALPPKEMVGHVAWRKPTRHYHSWTVKKRSGGDRILQAPKAELKRAQHWICREILDRVPAHEAAHAFVKRRSVASNARPHTRKAVVVALDLVEFFPSITFRRVRGVFRELGYDPEVAKLLAMLCTTAERLVQRPVPFYEAGHRRLPQGAPTSPQLSNLVCRRLDRRLAGLARSFGATYTRYADDLTFSGDEAFRAQLRKFLKIASKVIEREGFAINWKKRRIMRPSGRQRVAGVVVNERATLSREERRRLRAMLHHEKTGRAVVAPAGRTADAADYLRGRLAYLAMIDRRAAEALRGRR